MTTNTRFAEFIFKKFPNVPTVQISDRMICADSVKVSNEIIEKIKSEVLKYQPLKNWSQNHLDQHYLDKGLFRPNNFSVCDSFDFHINEKNELQLIEINTNSSFLALGLCTYEFFNKPNALEFNFEKLVQMFKDEIAFCKADSTCIYILDDKPLEQKVYIEFLIYKEIFKSFGLKCEIIDLTDVPSLPNNSFIYNRHTDFYLNDEKSSRIRARFNAGEIHLSPHPWEYFALADKERFLNWNRQSEIEKPKSLLVAYDLDIEDSEKIWSLRKKLFFKPKSSFGSKGAFRGESISRKTFDGFFGNGFIAQEWAPPGESEFNVEIVENNLPILKKIKMKYDLRCYAYQEQLQLVVARIYQGQTTNLRTEGGGFAIVEVI